MQVTSVHFIGSSHYKLDALDAVSEVHFTVPLPGAAGHSVEDAPSGGNFGIMCRVEVM